jgi:predicted metalloprotease with PDZ domain
VVTAVAILAFAVSSQQIARAAEQESPEAASPFIEAVETIEATETREPAEAIELTLVAEPAPEPAPAPALQEADAEVEFLDEEQLEVKGLFSRMLAGVLGQNQPRIVTTARVPSSQDAITRVLAGQGSSFLGVNIEDGADRGAAVRGVSPDSPASEAGIEVDDLITAFNGTPVVGAVQLTRLVSKTPTVGP